MLQLTNGQFFEGAACPDCKTPLPKLEDKGGWGLAECSTCHKRFDTDEYRSAGGKFHTGTGCKCERCSGMESN